MKQTRKLTTLLLLTLVFVVAVTAFAACKPKDYDMSGVAFVDATFTYDGTEKKLEITGTLPEGVTVAYANNTLTNVGEVVATATFTGDDKHNPIPPMTAKLKITPATLQGITLADKTVTYNGNEQVLEVTGTLPQGSSVQYTNNKTTNAGVYNVTAVVTNSNYDKITLNATFTIEKATYDMSGVAFTDKTVTYNGEAQSVVIAGTLPQGVTVSYTNNTLTNVGSTTATATFTGDSTNYNAISPKTATLTIEKATYDMSGVSFDDATYFYDGTDKQIEITGTLPEGVTVRYEDNILTHEQLGSVYATAIFTGDSANYNEIPPMTARLRIIFDLDSITFEDKTVTYNGQEQRIEVSGAPTFVGFSVHYQNNTLVNVGSITATASIAIITGQTATLTATLTIEKATYDMSGVTFDDKTVTYNGQDQYLTITGALPQGVTVSYTNNTLTNVGSVTATATFTGDSANYNAIAPKTATLTIEKATYDMSNVVFADKTVVYNGETQSLTIIGDLPQGVTVTYTDNIRTNVGSVTATATFTGDSTNYNAIPVKTATLTIEKATYDMSGITFVDAFIPYDGQPHTLEIAGTLPEGVTVSYTENTLTEAGELSVTATFTGDSTNYNAIPSKTALLTIVDNGTYNNVYFVISPTQSILRVVKDGEAVTNIPEVPEKAGYAGSWDANLSVITQEMVVLPKYEVINYVIGYVVGEGTNNPNNPTQYTVEQTLSLLSPTPSKIGYTFAGWFTTDTYEAGTRIYSIATGTTGNKTLYAKWIGYCIESAEGFSFDYEHYELPAITMTTSHNKTLLPLSTVIRVSEGCTWKLSNDIEGTAIITTKNISLQVGHNIKYVTVWYNENSDYNLVYILDVYRLDEYTYSFITDGVPYGEAMIGEENSAIAAPVAPQKTGYTFIGWQANGSETIVTFPCKLTMPTVFVAFYVANKYKVSHDAAGGIVDGTQTITVTFDQPFSFTCAFRTGYTFTGYTYNGLPIANGIWKIADDVTVTATWQAIDYTITYNLGGGTNNSSNPSIYTVEDAVTLATPTKRGYTFNGWFTTADFKEGTQISEIATGTIGNKTFYAKFTPTNYTITAIILVDEGGAEPVVRELFTQTVTFDAAYTLQQVDLDGYNFIKYVDLDGKNFTNGTYTIADNIRIVGVYQAIVYNITYNLNSGTNVSANPATYTIEDDTITFAQPTKRGYTFNGWFTTSDFQEGTHITEIVAGSFGDVEVWAKFTINTYNISYNLNGGTNDSGNPATYTVETATITLAQPTKTGYTFNGWFTSEDFADGTQVASIAKGLVDDVTLYAKFTPNNYTITYLPVGGTLVGEATQTVTYDSDFTLNNNISRTGYTFTGYTLDGEAFTSGTYQIADDITITATWQANTYTVTYIWQGETVNTAIATYDSAFTFATNVGKDGYEAVKWLNGDTEYASNSTINYTIDSNITLTAVVAYISTDFTFTTSGTNATITGYTGTDTEVIIPDYVKQDSYYYLVTAVGSNAFKDKSTITNITIPASVTSIGNYAFYYCSSLTSITIPSGVTSIGNYAFYNCSRLTNITVPACVTSIGSYAFSSCSSLEIVIFEENSQCTSIGDYAFDNCSSLTGITIPGGVTSIGKRTFEDCSKLTNITIPESITSIGASAFSGCSRLTYNEDDNAYYLGNATNPYIVLVKAKSTSITDCTIHSSTKIIYSSAFYGCSKLTSITIPNSITSIGASAFS